MIHYQPVELVHDGRDPTLCLESTRTRDDEDEARLDVVIGSLELVPPA